MEKERDTDHLYEIFEQHLTSTVVEDQTEEKFVSGVVEDYLRNLRSKGQLPLHYIEDIREDVTIEIYDMMLKKIYGHYSLKHFMATHGISKVNKSN